MIKELKKLFKWLFLPRPYSMEFSDKQPDVLKHRVLYIQGEGEYVWSAAMLCPCGCNEVIQLSLHPESRPRWKLLTHADSTHSLSPSVWRKVGCKSHFFLEHGQIKWCK